MQSAIEPLVNIVQVPEHKKSLKIIYFASEKDVAIPIEFARAQIQKLRSQDFSQVTELISPDIEHCQFKNKRFWNQIRQPVQQQMYESTYNYLKDENPDTIV